METATTCSKCKTPLGEEDVFCGNCGYPERGDTHEKYKYNYEIHLKEEAIEAARKKLTGVKIVLYIIAGINALLGIYYLATETTLGDGIASLIVAAIFIGFVFWVDRQPLTGILAAFIFWIVLQLLAMLIDPSNLYRGLLLKIIFIAIFIRGIASAREVRKYKAQLKETKS